MEEFFGIPTLLVISVSAVLAFIVLKSYKSSQMLSDRSFLFSGLVLQTLSLSMLLWDQKLNELIQAFAFSILAIGLTVSSFSLIGVLQKILGVQTIITQTRSQDQNPRNVQMIKTRLNQNFAYTMSLFIGFVVILRVLVSPIMAKVMISYGSKTVFGLLLGATIKGLLLMICSFNSLKPHCSYHFLKQRELVTSRNNQQQGKNDSIDEKDLRMLNNNLSKPFLSSMQP